MKCVWIEQGTVVCTRGGTRRQLHCPCGRVAARECDHEFGNGNTCDAPMCWSPKCGANVSKNRDFCNAHRDSDRQLSFAMGSSVAANVTIHAQSVVKVAPLSVYLRLEKSLHLEKEEAEKEQIREQMDAIGSALTEEDREWLDARGEVP